MKDVAHDIIASLWANSTFGILGYWWSANKAQDGRGSITTSQISKFSILDPRALTAANTKKAMTFFNSIKETALLPAYKLADDPVRAQIDDFILKELLDTGVAFSDTAIMLAMVRKKLSLEPSFNGGR